MTNNALPCVHSHRYVQYGQASHAPEQYTVLTLYRNVSYCQCGLPTCKRAWGQESNVVAASEQDPFAEIQTIW